MSAIGTIGMNLAGSAVQGERYQQNKFQTYKT